MPEDPRVKEIIEQIDDLFGDTSVPKERTLEMMEEIQSHTEGSILALKEDIKAESADE